MVQRAALDSMKKNPPTTAARTHGNGGHSPAQTWANTRLIRQLLADFRKLTGLAVLVVPASVPVRTVGFKRQENEFCRLVNEMCEGGCLDCRRAQRALFRRLGFKLKPQTVCCAGGLIQLAVPVIAGGQHVATLLGGKAQTTARPDFRAVAARLGLKGTREQLDSLRTAYARSPALPPPKLRTALRLLDALARLVGETLARPPAPFPVPDPPRLAQVKAYLKQHAGERLTTAQMARVLNLSNAYFCRLFRRLTGQTFHAYVARMRVEAAKQQLLRTFDPITEICYVAGFQSLSDFNRVFKACVGSSPSQFRREARQQSGREGVHRN